MKLLTVNKSFITDLKKTLSRYNPTELIGNIGSGKFQSINR